MRISFTCQWIDAKHVAVIDIGKPGENLGWAIQGPKVNDDGPDVDECIKALSEALSGDTLALGFEAPMFVPVRNDAATLTKARDGECVNGVNRPFSAGAGATVLVTALVVVPYVLARLREAAPEATATLDWRSPLSGNGRLLLFEAFVTNQKKSHQPRHIEDAHSAVAAFQRGMQTPRDFDTAVPNPDCLSLIGAMLLRTGWTTDTKFLSQPCLVVKV